MIKHTTMDAFSRQDRIKEAVTFYILYYYYDEDFATLLIVTYYILFL